MSATLSPTLFSKERALSLIESIIAQSQSDGVFASLQAGESALSRFSENQIGQNLVKNRFKLKITSYFGKRTASSSTTESDPEALRETLRRSEELARFAPEDPEWMPLLSPQTYDERVPAFDEGTANLSPQERGELVNRVCTLARNAKMEGSGSLSTEVQISAIGNSTGLRASDRVTEADFSFTARGDRGSSWGSETSFAIADIPLAATAKTTLELAKQAQNPQDIAPGIYPVIFTPSAFANLLAWTIWNMDARAADEGRSFMSRTDETGQPIGNRIGETLFSPLVQVRRDPAHPLLQSSTFFGGGLPKTALEIIRQGIPQTLAYSRYWGQEKNRSPTGRLFPFVMEGSDRTLEDLIGATERGLLINRVWYIGYVNPPTLEMTGMTRDGTFWIENGKISHPVKNLRFNQSFPDMLRDIDDLTSVRRCGESVVPGVRVKAFNFSSITDSI
ncbi:MAG: TldD/PmbA family protein [Cyanobacteria bacterium SBLK]|nr:TldD/PmbA family protein [Cyanobacteria bacterium SBLK]